MSIWNPAADWARLSDGLPLLRGLATRAGADFVTMASPADRTPVHMPASVQMEMDDWFEGRFGVRFRQRSIFSTGSWEVARDYAGGTGEVRVLCPAADFCFCWSPLCADLYGAYEATDSREPISTLLERLHFRCDDLSSAIRSSHEIMLVCSCVQARAVTAHGL